MEKNVFKPMNHGQLIQNGEYSRSDVFFVTNKDCDLTSIYVKIIDGLSENWWFIQQNDYTINNFEVISWNRTTKWYLGLFDNDGFTQGFTSNLCFLFGGKRWEIMLSS